MWRWEGEDEPGDGKDFLYWESIFKTHQQFFYIVIYFRIFVSSYYSIFLSWLRNVGEGNDFFGCGQAWGQEQFVSVITQILFSHG